MTLNSYLPSELFHPYTCVWVGGGGGLATEAANLFSEMCDQVRPKQICSATEVNKRLEMNRLMTKPTK